MIDVNLNVLYTSCAALAYLIAEVVLFASARPRSMRLMTTTFRPMCEGSWG